MKLSKIALVAVAALAFVFSSCGSTKVSRLAEDEVKDFSGYWNDSDVRIVVNTMLGKITTSGGVRNYIADFKENGGKGRPKIIVGKIANKSSEHLDTSIIATVFQSAIIEEGTFSFVADAKQREQLRNEKLDQAENASVETAKAIGNEKAADLMLQGTVTTIVDQASNGRSGMRTYQVSVNVIDIETNEIVWQGQDNSIRKEFKKAAVKL